MNLFFIQNNVDASEHQEHTYSYRCKDTVIWWKVANYRGLYIVDKNGTLNWTMNCVYVNILVNNFSQFFIHILCA